MKRIHVSRGTGSPGSSSRMEGTMARCLRNGRGRRERILKVYDRKRTYLDDDLSGRVPACPVAWSGLAERCMDCASWTGNFLESGRCWNCNQQYKAAMCGWLARRYPNSFGHRVCLVCSRGYLDPLTNGRSNGCPYSDCLHEASGRLLLCLQQWEVIE